MKYLQIVGLAPVLLYSYRQIGRLPTLLEILLHGVALGSVATLLLVVAALLLVVAALLLVVLLVVAALVLLVVAALVLLAVTSLALLESFGTLLKKIHYSDRVVLSGNV